MSLQIANRFDCLLLGSADVGKTQLRFRIHDNTFEQAYIPTIGFDHLLNHRGCLSRKYSVVLKQISGRRTFRSMIPSLYRDVPSIVLVYDISNRSTFDNVEMWMEEVNLFRKEDSQLVLVGNKADLEEKRVVSYQEGEEMVGKIRACCFIETSAKTARNVQTLFMTALRMFDESTMG